MLILRPNTSSPRSLSSASASAGSVPEAQPAVRSNGRSMRGRRYRRTLSLASSFQPSPAPGLNTARANPCATPMCFLSPREFLTLINRSSYVQETCASICARTWAARSPACTGTIAGPAAVARALGRGAGSGLLPARPILQPDSRRQLQLSRPRNPTAAEHGRRAESNSRPGLAEPMERRLSG